MAQRAKGSFKETIHTVLIAILIALGVRAFAYEPFNIPSGSMIPTLLVGDYLFVSKFSYGYSSYSLPFSLPVIDDRAFFEEPKRGDVAVFKLPSDTTIDYIKRLVGLPGDRIQVKNGVLHINGEAVKRERVEDYMQVDRHGSITRIPRFIETLPGGRQHYILESSGDMGSLDDTPEYTVPEGHYFGMGDNRDNSRDSRVMHEVGFIPRQNLIGRAEFMFFSVDGTVWEFWKWPDTVRFNRIFDGIE